MVNCGQDGCKKLNFLNKDKLQPFLKIKTATLQKIK